MAQTVRLFIEPTKIHLWHYVDIQRKEALEQLLHSGAVNSVWHSKMDYEYTYKSVTYCFNFSQSIIKLPPKEGKTHSRYKIYDPLALPIGKGGYGTTYPIAGAIKFNSGKLTVKNGSNKLVKIQEHSTDDRISAVCREYNSLMHAGHLQSSAPIFSNDTQCIKSYLIMSYAKGFTLEKILHPQKRLKIPVQCSELTVEKRLELTLAILNAIKTQVTDKGLIHRDIKPGNIIVDLNQNPPEVTVIDYGFAIEQGQQDYRRLGTRAYRAPESFQCTPLYTTKSDVYCAGRVLSYLWGDVYTNFYMDHFKNLDYIKTKSTNEQLFSLPEIELFLEEEDQYKIRACLAKMLNDNPDNRVSLDEAIRLFSEIDKEKYNTMISQQDSKTYWAALDRQLNPKIASIREHLKLLRSKEKELRRRECYDAAAAMKGLIDKVSVNTEFLKLHPAPLILDRYQKSCLKEIGKVNDVVEQHRDSQWLVAELAVAISLLGVGYLVALGINYYKTGRLGLFSQTKSSQLIEEFTDAISFGTKV